MHIQQVSWFRFIVLSLIFYVGNVTAANLQEFEFGGAYFDDQTSQLTPWSLRIIFNRDAIGDYFTGSGYESETYPIIEEWYLTYGTNNISYLNSNDSPGILYIVNSLSSPFNPDQFVLAHDFGILVIEDTTGALFDDTSLFGGGVISATPSQTYSNTLFTLPHGEVPVEWYKNGAAISSPLDHFRITDVNYTASTNSPLPIDIYAHRSNGATDTGFQNCVNLSTNHSALTVDPSTICLKNGLAVEYNITLSGPGSENAKLVASYRSVRGENNTFRVIDPQVVTSKLLVDVRYDSTLRALQSFSGEVSLKDVNGAIVKQSVQNSKGYYEFTGLKPGIYNLWAVDDSGDWRSPENYPFIVSAGHTNRTEFRTLLVKDVGKPPVLIIPGFAGSTVKGIGKYDELDVTAHLPEERALASELRILNFSPFDSAGPINGGGFSNLDTELSNNGFNVITVPWDWRVSISEDVYDNAWRVYLLEAIDNAKDPDGDGVDDFDQVDIVAHSMGGLLVRSYIQSNSYRFRNDIRRFAMVGTPNEGSAKAYYMVQGGNPKLSDDGDSRKCSGNPFRVNPACFFSRTTDRLYRALNDGESPFKKTFFRTDYSKAKSEKDLVMFYADYVPAGLQLQPTFDALYTFGTSPRQLTVKPNQFLLDLNSNDKKTRMSPFSEACTNTDKVGTEIFASANVKTLENIMVTLPVNGSIEYPDGRPISFAPVDSYARGDGTVLTSSAVGGGLHVDTTISESYGEHSRLMGSYKTEIRNFLQQECP